MRQHLVTTVVLRFDRPPRVCGNRGRLLSKLLGLDLLMLGLEQTTRILLPDALLCLELLLKSEGSVGDEVLVRDLAVVGLDTLADTVRKDGSIALQ